MVTVYGTYFETIVLVYRTFLETTVLVYETYLETLVLVYGTYLETLVPAYGSIAWIAQTIVAPHLIILKDKHSQPNLSFSDLIQIW